MGGLFPTQDTHAANVSTSRHFDGLDSLAAGTARRLVTAASGKPAAKTGPRKSLGQHFLADSRILARILDAADLSPEDTVVEIGPGRGVLTRRLVERVKRVIAVELDPRLAADLPGRAGSPGNLTCVEADAREADVSALVFPDTSYKVVANLPYYASNPIVRRLLESQPQPRLMVVMLQQEVAKNMTAQPGQMGILSVATQFYADAKTVCTVPPRAFRPPPKVTSAVVRLDVKEAPAVDVASADDFFAVVKAGFSSPRKQLRNSLSHGLSVATEAASAVLDEAGIDGQRRPQTLSLGEWGGLYHAWERTKQQWK